MTRKQPENTKLLVLPGDLVERLKDISSKKGLSLSSYAIETFEEAIRAESFTADLKDTVDTYHLKEVQHGAGSMIIPRTILGQLIKSPEIEGKQLRELWSEAGRWYGQYLKRSLEDSELLKFIRDDLVVSWNLDECEISDGDEARLRFVGFDMSEEFTELLLVYLKELMGSIGYREIERDNMRGMAMIKYLKLRN